MKMSENSREIDKKLSVNNESIWVRTYGISPEQKKSMIDLFIWIIILRKIINNIDKGHIIKFICSFYIQGGNNIGEVDIFRR